MCRHNDFGTLCHRDSFYCNLFIFIASFIYSDASELETIYRRHFDMGGGGGGGSLRDPPWVPLESTNARVLCSYGGVKGNIHPGRDRLHF